jgi:glycosyltransferase involved in cell wall biosynthesis
MSGPSVTHVLWSGGVGGIERLVVDLATEQVRAGRDVAVAFGRMDGPFVERLRERGVPVLDLGLASGYDVRGALRRAPAGRLAARDVVHLHAFNLPLRELLRRAGRPVVYTEHGFTAKGRLNLPAAAKARRRRRFLARSAGAVAANSAFTADRLSAALRLERTAIEVVHNGVDAGALPPVAARERGDGVTVACVARLVEWKRIELALRGVAAAGEGVRLLVAGDGPAREALVAEARRLGVAGAVEFLGFRDDVPAVLARADVLLQPSRDEWFGLAVVEGTAQGLLPVVFADAGGALEVLPPDGEVVRDVPELGALLRSLQGGEALSTAARERRGAWARSAFSIARTAEAYGRIYAGLGRVAA